MAVPKDDFQKWEFVLHLQIIHQLGSESISFLLGLRNGFQPDQSFQLNCSFTYICVQPVQKKDCLTAGLTINNRCHHLDIRPKYYVILCLQAGQSKNLGDPLLAGSKISCKYIQIWILTTNLTHHKGHLVRWKCLTRADYLPVGKIGMHTIVYLWERLNPWSRESSLPNFVDSETKKIETFMDIQNGRQRWLLLIHPILHWKITS
jgi:hypothetical protein